MRVQSGIAPARPARPAPRSAFMAAATSTPVSTAEPAPLSMSTPVEPAPRGPQPRAGESGTWFEAPCASGSVRLCVGPDAPAAQHAAEAAILLRHVEPLLAAMDDWAGTECAWRWAAAPAQGAADSVATVRWRGGSRDRHCVLSWPWALLRSLPAPPPELAARLDWPLVASVLVLARLQIDAGDLALLEPGGAVLVPQSMQPPWQGWLRAADESASEATAGVAVDLSTPWRPRLAGSDALECASSAPRDAMRADCELRLDLPLGVSALRLAGWPLAGDPGDIVHLAESGLRVALWRRATPGPDQRLARGRLMPWGDGWALAVEAVD